MTPPQMRPAYLVVPSGGLGDPVGVDPVIAGFVDGIAMFPATAERLLVGVAEYSTFVNELCPIGSPVDTLHA